MISSDKTIQFCAVSDVQDLVDNGSRIHYLKRFLERWHADYAFRDEYEESPSDSIESLGLPLSKEEVRWFTDSEFATKNKENIPQLVLEYRAFIQWKVSRRTQMRLKSPSSMKWKTWRNRQIFRTLLEQGSKTFEGIVHAPWAAELSEGCSVGCWFCGVSADAFVGNWVYTEDNKQTWIAFLQAMNHFAGELAEKGFCYWATDPFDNPEYEKFIEDFQAVFNRTPQVTTAIPMRDPERTLRYVQTAISNNGFVQRFSVTTKKDFDAIHDYFTPEELLFVELIPQFENRAIPKVISGRVRELVLDRLEKWKDIPFQYDLDQAGTISCVSGFLVNMKLQEVKLITPVPPSDAWPLGYVVYDCRNWELPTEIDSIVEEMIRHHMKISLKLDDTLALSHHTTLEVKDAQTLLVHGLDVTVTLNNVVGVEHIVQSVVERITVRECLQSAGAFDPADVMHALNALFARGVLADYPTTGTSRKESVFTDLNVGNSTL